MQPSKLAKRAWFLLFILIAAFYLYGLGHLPLVGPDEPRYAEVAREMFNRRDFVTPTLGGLPWFEKPALLYWLMIASYRVFGVDEFTARIGPAICGLATAAFVYWTAHTVSDRGNQTESPPPTVVMTELPRWSTLALVSSISIIAFSRAATFDIVITATITAALSFFFVWDIRHRTAHVSERVKWWLLPGFYVFIALSLLAKGLIGIVLPFGIIALYFVLRREWPRPFFKSLVWGLPLAILLAATWYGPMTARHGWVFIDQFFIQHHFARFLTNKYRHPQPLYFYLLTLTWLMLPWTVFVVAAFVSARRWSWRGDNPVDRLRVFALAWLIAPVVFFSFSESKLAAYILPVVPAAALLVGERIDCALRAGKGERVFRLTGTVLLILSAIGAWFAWHAMEASKFCAVGIVITPAGAGIAGLLLPRFRRPILICFALSALVAGAVGLHCGAAVLGRRDSVRDLLAVAQQRGYGATPIVQLFNIQRTAEFYGAGRLTYRPDGEPKMLESAGEVADAARRTGGTVLCIVPVQLEWQLTAYRGLKSEELARNDRVGLLVVRANSP